MVYCFDEFRRDLDAETEGDPAPGPPESYYECFAREAKLSPNVHHSFNIRPPPTLPESRPLQDVAQNLSVLLQPGSSQPGVNDIKQLVRR